MKEFVDRREKLSRKKRWEQLDEDITYTATELDKSVVNPNQIRLVIRTFKEHLPKMFPDRFDENGEFEVPKTLIFAKTDSHADDIIQIVREEFGEENRFCKKITYKADEDPKSVLSQFRNDYHPRIAVTVDMIATGTDVKPLECLLFMRDVRSRNYFEQMKGRGTRTITLDALRKVTPTAKFAKDHFVIVDAVGVTKSCKTDSRPLEQKARRGFERFAWMRSRLACVKKIFFRSRQSPVAGLTGKSAKNSVSNLRSRQKAKRRVRSLPSFISVYSPDRLDDIEAEIVSANPSLTPEEVNAKLKRQHEQIIEKAAAVFTGEFNEFVENVRKSLDQIIDIINPDKVTKVGWDEEEREAATNTISEFAIWILENKDEITALQIFYNLPFRRRELTFKMIRDLCDKLKMERPKIAPLNVWQAYQQLGETEGAAKTELTALVALIRKTCGIDEKLTDFGVGVDRRFQTWVFGKQSGALKFNEEQMQWLRMIKDHVATSFHIQRDDFEYEPFAPAGGLGKMYQLFGDQMEPIIEEINEALAA